MNLIIDIGNTRFKLALFDRGELVADCSAEGLDASFVARFTGGRRPAKAILSSTRGPQPVLAAMLRTQVDRLVEFTPCTPVPIRNDYLTPETLGRDRLAAAVGATVLYPGRNALIVDFGTAVTFDLVTADATYRGGCISPGLTTRFRALHDYTAALPLVGPSETPEELLGRTTCEALRRGVMNSLCFEIEGYISRMEEKIDDLCVIFTGGDAKYFAKRIKNTIFANCNLVFYGLNRILEYDASEEHLD